MNLESRVEKLEQETEDLRSRNKRVEADKDWETSLARIASITILTYLSTAIVFYSIGIDNPYFNALVPTLAFFISMQSLPFIRKRWNKKKT
jgi:hypothetical protein